MKSAAFNQLFATYLTMPLSAVTDYTRRLKEAGLMSTSRRGEPAPDMTPLDAARLVLAVITSPHPFQCVERVKRFGQMPYSPNSTKRRVAYEVIQPDEFKSLFHGETLEEVLEYIFSIPAIHGEDAAYKWFRDNVFHLTVSDFFVRAELVKWVTENGIIVKERAIPFKGEIMVTSEDGTMKHVEGFTRIPGGVRTERSIIVGSFLSIGLGLLTESGGAVQ